MSIDRQGPETATATPIPPTLDVTNLNQATDRQLQESTLHTKSGRTNNVLSQEKSNSDNADLLD